jgi:hypothetical protein
MYIIMQAWFPANIASQVVQRHMEVMQKYPPDASQEDAYGKTIAQAFKNTKEGVHAIAVVECKEGTLEASLAFQTKLQLEFADLYTFAVDVYMNNAEAYASMGMQRPE